jgi:endogenous inhibitor of DNA gyrase (YacG/DUF329 family)
MPFCSERCRLIDIGKWADGDYRIPLSDPVARPDAQDDVGAQDADDVEPR